VTSDVVVFYVGPGSNFRAEIEAMEEQARYVWANVDVQQDLTYQGCYVTITVAVPPGITGSEMYLWFHRSCLVYEDISGQDPN